MRRLKKEESPNFYFLDMAQRTKFTLEDEEQLWTYVLTGPQHKAVVPKISGLTHYR